MERLLVDEGTFSRNTSSVKRTRHVAFLCNQKGKSGRPSKKPKVKKRAQAVPEEGAGVHLAHVEPIETPLGLTLEGLGSASQSAVPSSAQTWAERQESEARAWADVRPSLFGDLLSTHAAPMSGTKCGMETCNELASVSCLSCAMDICHGCDIGTHSFQPVHKRRHWTLGFFEPLEPGKTMTANGDVVCFDAVLPLPGVGAVCEQCQGNRGTVAGDSSAIVIFMTGQYSLSLPKWKCLECGAETDATRSDVLRGGFWVGSPTRLTTIVHEDVLMAWKSLKLKSPGTSLTAFAGTLREVGKTYGTTSQIDVERLQTAYMEWSFALHETKKLSGAARKTCEACGSAPFCVHVDGNHKLYRYRSSDNSLRPYHEGTVIKNPVEVDNHLRKLDGIKSSGIHCGQSRWAAAKNRSAPPPSKRGQDQTGLVVATCRHSVILGAADMYHGERFGYAHFLHQLMFSDVAFFASDVCCKYWPWAQRVAEAFPEFDTGSTQPYLSVMHAFAHTYYCQVTFGGLWQDGSGWSIMETTEQANALLSRAANTTKYMTSGHRVDAITDLILDYNEKKHDRMPNHLVKRLKAASSRVSELRAGLEAKLQEQQVDDSQLDVMVTELRALAASLSGRDTNTDGPDLRVAIEAVSDSIRARTACIRNEADTAKKRCRARRLLSQDRTKLIKLVQRFQAETGVSLSVQDAEEGCFPWDSARLSTTNLELSARRALADLHMRLRRSEEELIIVKGEMERLLEGSSFITEQLSSTLQEVETQLLSADTVEVRPSERISSGRYEVDNESRRVLYGFSSILRRQIMERKQYSEQARAMFDKALSE